MSANSTISWTDHTFNPWWGCAKVSPACDHCYAERDAKRFAAGRVLWGVDAERRTFGDKHWEEPKKWNARRFSECMNCRWRGPTDSAKLVGDLPGFDIDPGPMRVCPSCAEPLLKETRARVFCASMADVFDKNAPEGARARLFRLIRITENLDWMLLTKRIGNALPMAFQAGAWGSVWPHNVWLGSTVVNQEEANRDIPKLLRVPARIHFVSIEPMLGPIDLTECGEDLDGYGFAVNALTGKWDAPGVIRDRSSTARVDWVICGGESGPRARPMHPAWPASLRDQCAAAGVAFHFKQWGEWIRWEPGLGADRICHVSARDGAFGPNPGQVAKQTGGYEMRADTEPMANIGVKRTGRALDGVVHDGFPL